MEIFHVPHRFGVGKQIQKQARLAAGPNDEPFRCFESGEGSVRFGMDPVKRGFDAGLGELVGIRNRADEGFEEIGAQAEEKIGFGKTLERDIVAAEKLPISRAQGVVGVRFEIREPFYTQLFAEASGKVGEGPGGAARQENVFLSADIPLQNAGEGFVGLLPGDLLPLAPLAFDSMGF